MLNGSKKILAVDDDMVLRGIYKDVLNGSGYSVETAANGLDALKKLMDRVFDLVITDVNMPGLDGIGLYLSAIRRHPYLKDRFLFVTGNPVAEREARGVINQMQKSCISKPFKLKELLRHVDSLTIVPLAETAERHGMRIRSEERVKTSASCYLFFERVSCDPIVSRAQNLSAGGIKLQYIGKPLDAGTEVSLSIESMEKMRRACVVWAKGADKLVTAGLKFLEPLAPSSARA